MSRNLNIQLTDELRRYVAERTSDNSVYSTPSEYIRDLISHDRESHNEEIASILMDARRTPVTPLESDYIHSERNVFKKKSTARREKT